MINELELTNFKKHEKLTVSFQEGLIGLKGANENGKSSLLHGINYAFFGARALPMSLAETVTWGKPESSLKVGLKFTVDTILYKIVRSKSGAELTASGLLVSGQAEVTKYAEGLFKVNADAASKLMIASQGKLRGALESKEAIPLIEKLANINLVDQLIVKVQEQLPSGSTKSLVETLARVSEEVKPEADFSEQETNIEMLALEESNAVEGLDFLVEGLKSLDIVTANKLINTRATQEADLHIVKGALRAAKERLSWPALSYESNLDELYAKAEKQRQETADFKAYETFQKYVPTDRGFEGDLGRAASTYQLRLSELEVEKTMLTKQRLTAALGRINEDSCALCGKLLQDVPEVVEKNSVCDSRIGAADIGLATVEQSIKTFKQLLGNVNFLIGLDSSTKMLQAQLSLYTKLERVNGLLHILWTAAVPTRDPLDYADLLKQSKAKQTEYIVDTTAREVAEKKATANQEWLDQYVEIDVTDACKILQQHENLNQLKQAAHKRLETASRSLIVAEAKLNTDKTVHEHALAAYARTQELIVRLKADIAAYDKNNALVKRLREVRPIVASRLWNVVLNAVSHYFSQIRGTQTVITMNGDSFLADGRPVEGLSGSTLDSLGLAIRIALGKTFLPSLDFLLLDEPAQGMDDERESAMLGVLASADYKQTIVVTHSTLADSFASDIIQL
jgi:DNA repair exonuclease SbcCD ATPase subunit